MSFFYFILCCHINSRDLSCLDAKVGTSKQRRRGGSSRYLHSNFGNDPTALLLLSRILASCEIPFPAYVHTYALHPALRPCDHPRGSSPIQYRPLSPRGCALSVLMGKCGREYRVSSRISTSQRYGQCNATCGEMATRMSRPVVLYK